jgi:hypothetical protein
VSKPTEIVKAHQTCKIVVGFDGNNDSMAETAATTNAATTTTTNTAMGSASSATMSGKAADVMAKLVVTAPKSAGAANHVQWVYYLKGTS